MSPPLKNILIAGATGSVGAPILAALLAEPSFAVTILSRASSSARFPPGIPVKTVSDAFTTAELTEAFRGQDAVVSAITTSAVVSDGREGLAYRVIDAAIAAGVKRFIPSEYGTNNLDPRARSVVPIYDAKGDNLEYLIAKAKESEGAFTWTSISCGSWLDWALDPSKSGNFLGLDIKNRKATIYDSGEARYAITTSTNTALAVVKSLENADLTANKQVYLADFTTCQREVIAALEKEVGEKFDVEERDSAPELRALREKYDGGDGSAAFGLLAITFHADVDVGYNFEKEQEIWNEKLGLPKNTLEEVVRDAAELSKTQ